MDIRSIIKEDFIVVDEGATVSELIGKLKTYEKRSGLVFRKNKYLGLVEKKRLMQTRIDVGVAKVKKYVKKTPVLSQDTDVFDAARLLFDSNVDFLPVEQDKKIIGVVEAVDLARLAAYLPETKGLKASDIKFVRPTMLTKDDPIARAIDAMHDETVDQLPIFEGGELYGIISFRDLLRKYLNWTPKRDISAKFNKMAGSRGETVDMPHLASLPVSSFSTNDNLIATTPKARLVDVVGLMIQNRVSDVIVMGESFVGLLTARNILQKVGSLKPEQLYDVKYVGVNKVPLMPHQQASLVRITEAEAEKLVREVKNPFDLVVHLKNYGKGGTQQKFSVHLKVEFPGKAITCAHDDWKLETALHKAFEHAHNAVKNRFHGDTTKGKTVIQ